jgi:ketosteroid isomerase-like protein
MREQNLDLVRKVYGAYVSGDAGVVTGAFHHDIRWHNSGHDENAGTYEGIPAVIGYLMGDDHMEDYALEVVDMLVSDERVAVVARTTGRRGDRTIRNDFIQLIQIGAGQIVEVWNYYWDQRTVAEFLATPMGSQA